MSKRHRPRSNHKPRGAQLVNDRLGHILRRAINRHLTMWDPSWRPSNRIELVWEDIDQPCPDCGECLCEVLAHPGPPWAMPCCLRCECIWSAQGAVKA